MIDGLTLAINVHGVIADDRAVFLNIGTDRYFKLGRAQTAILMQTSSAPRDRLVGQLVQKGLVAGPDQRSSHAPRSPAPPCAAQGSGVVSVLRACHWAADALRKQRFSDIVHWARAARTSDASVDHALIARFLSRRPFYARDYNCLFDSLALTRFLRTRGVAGNWVFGVRGAPFAAHCWVELDGEPVNDEAGFVMPFVTMLVL